MIHVRALTGATGILARYVVSEFLRIFLLCIASFVALYLLIDFFDRFDDFLKFQAPVGSVVRYFLYKIPLMVTQVMPVAVLAAMLLSLGGLSRHNEVTAMSACGLSLFQFVAPLLATCAALSVASIVWNETAVPHFNRKARYINTVEIKKRELPSLFGTSEVWSHAEDGIYNVKLFDPRKEMLVGLTQYRISPEFRLTGIVEIPFARWNRKKSRWTFKDGIEREFLPSGEVRSTHHKRGVVKLRETPSELATARREADEYGYGALSDLIENLRRKGLDPTEYSVDLHLKIAVPFISLVMAFVSIPFGIRNLRSSSLASNIGTGLVLGFSYWVVLALAVSLGHSGAIPAVVSAWAANGIFAAAGVYLLLGAL